MKLTEKMARDLQYWYGPETPVKKLSPAEVLAEIEAAGSLREWVRRTIEAADKAEGVDYDREWSMVWSDVSRIEAELDLYTVEARHEMLPVIEKKIKQLNRRASKLGCPQIELLVGPDYEIEVEKKDAFGDPIVHKYVINEVSVHGTAPKLEGWELVAVVDHTESGNIFRRFPEMEAVDLEQYRTVGRKCEHCNTSRRRKDTVILRNVETMELKMVGKTCLKDFTGHMHPTQVLNLYSNIRTWLDELNASGGVDEMREEPEVELEWFLRYTHAYIRADGWTSRGKAFNTEGLTATADKVIKLVRPPVGERERREQKKEQERLHLIDEDTEVAEGAVKWAAMELQPKGDYEYSIQAIAKNGYTTYRQAGYAASIVNAYLRHCGQVAEEQQALATATSKYQGAIKERLTRTVTLVERRVIPFNDGYGESTLDLFTMKDADGNVYIWFTSSGFMYADKAEECMMPVEVGMTVEAKMTVKGHDVFRGVPQTKVNRVSVLRRVEEESAA